MTILEVSQRVIEGAALVGAFIPMTVLDIKVHYSDPSWAERPFYRWTVHGKMRTWTEMLDGSLALDWRWPDLAGEVEAAW